MPWSVPFQGIISFISSSQLHTGDLQSHTANLSSFRFFFGKGNDPGKWKLLKNVAKGNKSVLTSTQILSLVIVSLHSSVRADSEQTFKIIFYLKICMYSAFREGRISVYSGRIYKHVPLHWETAQTGQVTMTQVFWLNWSLSLCLGHSRSPR